MMPTMREQIAELLERVEALEETVEELRGEKEPDCDGDTVEILEAVTSCSNATVESLGRVKVIEKTVADLRSSVDSYFERGRADSARVQEYLRKQTEILGHFDIVTAGREQNAVLEKMSATVKRLERVVDSRAKLADQVRAMEGDRPTVNRIADMIEQTMKGPG